MIRYSFLAAFNVSANTRAQMEDQALPCNRVGISQAVRR